MKKNTSWVIGFTVLLLLLVPAGSAFARDNVEQSSAPLMDGNGGYVVKLQYYDTYDGTLKFALGTEKDDDCTFNSKYVSREFATPKTNGVKPYELTYTWKDLPDGAYCTGWFESNERTTKLGVNTFKDFDFSPYANTRKITVTSNKVNKEKFKLAYASVNSDSTPWVEVKIDITDPNVEAKYQMVLGTETNSKGACLQDNTWKGSEHNPYNGTTTVEGGAVDSFLNEDRSLYSIKDWWGKGLHNNLPSGTYCIGLNRQRIEGAWLTEPSMWNLGSFTIPEYYTPIVDKPTNAAPNGYNCISEGTDTYCMLAPLPIPDVNGNIDPTGKINVKEGVGIYIESIIKLVIGIIGVLAVLMIVIGGIEYMSTISLGEKEGAKSRIMNALFGLLLALGSYILLNTINPALTDVSVNITGVGLSDGIVLGENGTITDDTEFIVKDPNAGVQISKPTTQETSDEMAKICTAWDKKVDCEGKYPAKCKEYAARIDALVSDTELARFMKANMVEESGCDINSVGYDGKGSYGIFQLLVPTAQTYAPSCGVTEKITQSWLTSAKNVDKSICIQEKFIRYLQTRCGQDWRNIAAAQSSGPGWCKPSNDCKNETSCIPENTKVKAWECPYDNPEHTKKNTRLEPARNASRKMMYCMDHPSSWM